MLILTSARLLSGGKKKHTISSLKGVDTTSLPVVFSSPTLPPLSSSHLSLVCASYLTGGHSFPQPLLLQEPQKRVQIAAACCAEGNPDLRLAMLLHGHLGLPSATGRHGSQAKSPKADLRQSLDFPPWDFLQ